MSKLIKKSKIFLDRHASTILTCVGGIGVIATAVLAAKATPKAMALLDEMNRDELTALDKAKIVAPIYIPTIITGTATITCIFGANALSKRQQASLMSAYALLDSSFKEYKNKISNLYGEEANTKAITEIARSKYGKTLMANDEDGQLFYDEYSNRYFRSTSEDILKSELKANEILNNDEYLSLNELYDIFGLEQVPYGDDTGWSSAQMYEMHWNSWINFNHEHFETDDGLEGTIITFTDPSINFEAY